MIYKNEQVSNLCEMLIAEEIARQGYTMQDWKQGKIENNTLDGIVSSSGYYRIKNGTASQSSLFKVLKHFGIEFGIYAHTPPPKMKSSLDRYKEYVKTYLYFFGEMVGTDIDSEEVDVYLNKCFKEGIHQDEAAKLVNDAEYLKDRR